MEFNIDIRYNSRYQLNNSKLKNKRFMHLRKQKNKNI